MVLIYIYCKSNSCKNKHNKPQNGNIESNLFKAIINNSFIY